MTATLGSLTTALRALCRSSSNGVTALGAPHSDGGTGCEDEILRILQRSKRLDASSHEMLAQATDWPQRYHLSPERANVLRPLQIPRDARVLEIGAACGAVTRYLGEAAVLVDALESRPARARCAAARTRDLPSVRVFCGDIDDLPAGACYDVIVVIGVLEYVGAGVDPQAYRDFLAAVRDRLVDGGSLVLAIENKLGAKYLAGAAEDHSNRVFDSVEGYPQGGRARTLDRRTLTGLLTDAGLQTQTAIAFPDHKLTRAVFRPDLVTEQTESLLYRVPTFPSPDWVGTSEPLADERSVWRSMVQAGLAADTGNSFLMIGGKRAGSGPMTPQASSTPSAGAASSSPKPGSTRHLSRWFAAVGCRAHR